MDALQAAKAAVEVAEEAARTAYQSFQWPPTSDSHSNNPDHDKLQSSKAAQQQEDKFVFDLINYQPSNTTPCTTNPSTSNDSGSKSLTSQQSLIPPPPKQLPDFSLPPTIDNNSTLETGVCTRCKKDFPQPGPKPFKLCAHCRELQRQRSRRWQTKTKQKEGVCRRCGVVIPSEHSEFVLCEHCRMSLRSRKANRAAEGRCVHCSGPNEEDAKFKVCLRCRQNDKIRRSNLEKLGACNRCAQPLTIEEKGKKVCSKCRSKKRAKDEDSFENGKPAKIKTPRNNSYIPYPADVNSITKSTNEASNNRKIESHQIDVLGQQQAVDAATAALLLPDFVDDQRHELTQHQLTHIHHAQLDQHLSQQLHGQLNELASSGTSRRQKLEISSDGGQRNGVEENDDVVVVDGSLTIPDPDKICISCGQSIHIDDLNINPATNTCSKCFDASVVQSQSQDEDEGVDNDSAANLFMNPEADEEIKKKG